MKNKNNLKRLTALSIIGVMSVTNPDLVCANTPYQSEITYEFVPTITLTKNANIRTGTSLNSPIACTLPAGTQIKLRSEYPEWFEVELNGYTYFVSKTCAVISTYSQVNNNPVKYLTTNSYANLYSTASFENYIGVIPPNVGVEVYLEDGEFIFIKYNNQVGFVEKSRLYGYNHDYNYDYNYNYNNNYNNNNYHHHDKKCDKKHHRDEKPKYEIYESYFEGEVFNQEPRNDVFPYNYYSRTLTK